MPPKRKNESEEEKTGTPNENKQEGTTHCETPRGTVAKKPKLCDLCSKSEANEIVPLAALKVGSTSVTVAGKLSSKGILAETIHKNKYIRGNILDTTGVLSFIAFGKNARIINKFEVGTCIQFQDVILRPNVHSGIPELTVSDQAVTTATEGDYPDVKLDFISLKDALQKPIGSKQNVVAIITSIDDLTEGTNKNGIPYTNRAVCLTDHTRTEMILKLWGKQAKGFDLEAFSVIALQECVINEFKDTRELTYGFSSGLWKVSPDTDGVDKEVHEFAKQLKQWFKINK